MAKPGGSKYKRGLCSHFVRGIFVFLHFPMFSLPIASCLFLPFHPSILHLGSFGFSFPLVQLQLSKLPNPPPARAPYIDAAVHRCRHTLMLLSIPEHMTKQGAAREVGEPVVLATDWFAKCKRSAAAQGEERACPQSVINLSNRSWCMSYISPANLQDTKKARDFSWGRKKKTKQKPAASLSCILESDGRNFDFFFFSSLFLFVCPS